MLLSESAAKVIHAQQTAVVSAKPTTAAEEAAVRHGFTLQETPPILFSWLPEEAEEEAGTIKPAPTADAMVARVLLHLTILLTVTVAHVVTIVLLPEQELMEIILIH